MILILFIFFIYFLNISLLFQNQSLVIFFCFYLILLFFKTKYIDIKFNSFYLESLEWTELFKFFFYLKNWQMYYIRFLNIKLFSFYKFIKFIKNAIINLFNIQLKKLKNKYIGIIYESGIAILNRIEFRSRYLKNYINSDIYIIL